MGSSISSKISWQLTSEALTVVFPDGEQTVISRDDPRFRTAVTAIRNKDFSRETFNKFKDARKVLETWGSGRVLISKDNTLTVVDGGVEHPVNEKLSQVIMEYIRNDWPVEAFAKFVIRLMKNPSMRSRDLFYDFIKLYNIAITDTGMCRAYKAITNDWKDKHTGKVDNRIGITVPPFNCSQVDDNPDNACSFGLIMVPLIVVIR